MSDSAIPDLFDKITDESSLLGTIASKIPGFSGYIERGRRREADQMLRESIAGRLEEIRLQLSGVQEELSHDIILAIDYAEPIGRADNRLMGLIGKIKDAPQGYAGFFDAVKVKEEDLARIYAFDESMIKYGDQISADVAALGKAVMDSGDIRGAVRTLDSNLQQAVTTFNTRQEVVSGIS